MANYSLLYHDVEHGMMIQYIATPDREERAKEMAEYRKARKESIEAAKAQDPALAKQLYGSVFRFVTSLNDLREKALILRARARRPLCGTREGLHHAAGRQHEAGSRD